MSRASSCSLPRAVGVWTAVTATTGVSLAVVAPLVAPGAWTATAPFADLLVRVCGLALGVALLRLWTVTTVTVGQLLSGVTPATDGATRRWVVLACGAALAAGATWPASATEGDGVLDGLRLPERAVAGPVPLSGPAGPALPTSAGPPPAHVHVVRPGESLWSIAAATSPPGTDLDRRWRSIWAANRDVVGHDPQLILPGQRLRVPGGGEPGRDLEDVTEKTTAEATAETTAETTAEATGETGDRP